MSVVAVVNRKGGSGKSTLATHLAAWYAHHGASVLLADVDRQQSTRTWLRQRKQSRTAGSEIVGWSVDPRTFVRPPSGADFVVLDTPGGLTGLDLARVVMYADAILMPVCDSIFDRESAADCLAELRILPRIASGRCQIGAVGMRLDPRTQAASVVQAWAAEQKVALVSMVGESSTYVRCIERGLTLFDVPAAEMESELSQWSPILQWLRPLLPAVARSTAEESRKDEGAAVIPLRPSRAVHARAPAAVARRPAALVPPARSAAPRPVLAAPVSPMGRLLGTLSIPRFLQRTP
ncbi:MAG TPA: ParA family protein [Burkholderiaceae bacterium]|nr:ParA family protein [Burkholderiaceae bacterium]